MRDRVASRQTARVAGAAACGAALPPAAAASEDAGGAEHRLVGRSAAMRRVRDRVRRYASSRAPVLVQGESGTGKELVARLVHELSDRADGPFVAVDCGAISESLLESELFGHARGAFTGAAAERLGLFEAAHGGTLFLDEVANTTLAFQARLLRVLERREVRRVGCNRPRPVDVRVVAASNRDLAQAVSGGSFREDLLYRLDVLQVRLPPLRDRRADVPLLAGHLLAEIGERAGLEYALAPRALSALLAHSWPGNVRELANVLERAAAVAPADVIEVEDLPERFAEAVGVARTEPPLPWLAAAMRDVERALLRERLDANGWNRTRTARELGITRRALFNKIARHGLDP